MAETGTGVEEEFTVDRSRLRTMIESLGEGLLVVGSNGRLHTSNPAAERLLGLTHAELLARTPASPFSGAVDASLRPVGQEALPVAVALRTGVPVLGDTLGFRLPTGDLRWLEVSAYPVLGQQPVKPDSVVVLLKDVTAARAEIERGRFQGALLDSAGQAIIATDTAGTIIFWNKAAERIYGWPAQEALGRNVVELIPSALYQAEGVKIFAELAAGRSWTGEFEVRHRDGTSFPAMVTNTPMFDDDGTLTAIIGISSDITERKRTEQVVRRLSAIVESSSDAIVGTDLEGTILSWNGSAERLYGYTAAEATGQDIRMLAPDRGAADDDVSAVLRRIARSESVQGFETVRRRNDGNLVETSLTLSPVYADDGTLIGCSGIARDDTARKQAERALSHQALHDTLTGLPNRALLRDRLEHALAHARGHGERVAVMFLDLDGFKVVNDGLGHQAGDDLLVKVSHRLGANVRPEDTVARFGGDEFVVVCEVESIEAAILAGNRLLAAIEAPFVLAGQDDGEQVSVSASIGLVVADGEAAPEDLLQDADTAMYRAKARGRARLELFDRTWRDTATARLANFTALGRAVERDELRVVYQPVISVADNKPVAVEALVRWQHPERGLVQPNDFIALAEETGLIVSIGRWVLRAALRERARWQAALPNQAPLRLAVNLSARQLSDPDLRDDVVAALAEFGATPDSLILEITESVLMLDVGSYMTLHALRNLGVSLHVDDFGTGYSSLAHLKDLPVDALKIDKSFVDGLGTGDADRSLVAAVIAMAGALCLEVIAEGVETELQLSVLRELQCGHAQGFLFARPMAYDDLVGWLGAPDRPGATIPAPRSPREPSGATPTGLIR